MLQCTDSKIWWLHSFSFHFFRLRTFMQEKCMLSLPKKKKTSPHPQHLGWLGYSVVNLAFSLAFAGLVLATGPSCQGSSFFFLIYASWCRHHRGYPHFPMGRALVSLSHTTIVPPFISLYFAFYTCLFKLVALLNWKSLI